MILAQLHALRTETGQQLLAELAGESLAEHDLLRVVEHYRQHHAPDLVSAAVELALLRRKAAQKFSRADRMYFTRDALEMASAEPVARHTARRFSGLRRVMDLACGIGGDALALAEAADRVIAVDRDSLVLEMARANARALHLEDRLDFIETDVTEFLPTARFLVGPVEAIFIDPSRRESRAAARRPEEYAPPLSWCLRLTDMVPRVAAKVSPALDYETALSGAPAEVEIISLNGECKEAVLWLGEFRSCARRATLLPGESTLTEQGPASEEIGDIGEWLYEPDPAVIRAHLVQRLAGEYGLRRIDPEIAYLTGDREVSSPFLAGFRVTDVVPWNLKRLQAYLREHRIGRAVIKKRGFPIQPDELRKQLKLAGDNRATLICTRAMGKPVVIIAG